MHLHARTSCDTRCDTRSWCSGGSGRDHHQVVIFHPCLLELLQADEQNINHKKLVILLPTLCLVPIFYHLLATKDLNIHQQHLTGYRNLKLRVLRCYLETNVFIHVMCHKSVIW